MIHVLEFLTAAWRSSRTAQAAVIADLRRDYEVLNGEAAENERALITKITTQAEELAILRNMATAWKAKFDAAVEENERLKASLRRISRCENASTDQVAVMKSIARAALTPTQGDDNAPA